MFHKIFCRYKKVSVTFASLFFFLANYQICQYFYPLGDEESIRNWWLMKINIYILVMMFCYLSACMNWSNNKTIKNIEKIMTYIALGFATSNFIDRSYLGDDTFTATDLMIVIVVVMISYWRPLKLKQQIKNLIQ